jgi:hypothetical protein
MVAVAVACLPIFFTGRRSRAGRARCSSPTTSPTPPTSSSTHRQHDALPGARALRYRRDQSSSRRPGAYPWSRLEIRAPPRPEEIQRPGETRPGRSTSSPSMPAKAARRSAVPGRGQTITGSRGRARSRAIATSAVTARPAGFHQSHETPGARRQSARCRGPRGEAGTAAPSPHPGHEHAEEEDGEHGPVEGRADLVDALEDPGPPPREERGRRRSRRPPSRARSPGPSRRPASSGGGRGRPRA